MISIVMNKNNGNPKQLIERIFRGGSAWVLHGLFIYIYLKILKIFLLK